MLFSHALVHKNTVRNTIDSVRVQFRKCFSSVHHIHDENEGQGLLRGEDGKSIKVKTKDRAVRAHPLATQSIRKRWRPNFINNSFSYYCWPLWSLVVTVFAIHLVACVEEGLFHHSQKVGKLSQSAEILWILTTPKYSIDYAYSMGLVL